MHERPPADPDPYSKSDDNFGSVTAARLAAVADPVRGIMAQQRPLGLGEVEAEEEAAATATAQGGYHGDVDDADAAAGGVDLLDDVFGEAKETEGSDDGGLEEGHEEEAGAAPPSAMASATVSAIAAHPSDMNRLRHDHSTAGYRDGLTAAKAASVQAGFDEGYALGAALGGEVGELLGLLEGLARGESVDAGGAGDQDEPVAVLLARARQQLTVPAVFAPAYFAADGTWLYAVAGPDDDDDHEPTVFDVAKAHPLVRVWRGVVGVQLYRFGVRWGDAGAEAELAAVLGLQGGEDEEDAAADGSRGPSSTTTATATATTTTTARAPPSSTTVLDW